MTKCCWYYFGWTPEKKKTNKKQSTTSAHVLKYLVKRYMKSSNGYLVQVLDRCWSWGEAKRRYRQCSVRAVQMHPLKNASPEFRHGFTVRFLNIKCIIVALSRLKDPSNVPDECNHLVLPILKDSTVGSNLPTVHQDYWLRWHRSRKCKLIVMTSLYFNVLVLLFFMLW